MPFLTEVESSIRDLVNATGFDKFDENNPSAKYAVGDVKGEVRFEPDGKWVPAISIAIHAGTFERVTINKWNGNIVPSLLVLFANKGIAEEEERRAGVHPILEGLIALLSGNDLGGVCEPLSPKSFKEEEIEKYNQAGWIAFRVLFETEVTVTGIDPDEAVEDLLKLVISYHQPSDEEVPRVVDEIVLS